MSVLPLTAQQVIEYNNIPCTPDAAPLGSIIPELSSGSGISLFTATTQGVVPGSGGGATNFLRADGTWQNPTAGAAGYDTIQEDGVALTQRHILNFVGVGITAVDNGGVRTNVSLNPFTSTTEGIVPLSGGGTANFLRADGTWAAPTGGYSTIQEDGVSLTQRSTLNFVGDTFTASDTGSKTQVVANNFTSTTAGVVPLSGGGTANFLRADGTWATPPGSGTITGSGAANQVAVFSGATAIGSSAGLGWDGTTFTANGAASFNSSLASVNHTVGAVGQANALFVRGSDGNVGIGTATPTQKLRVEKNFDGAVQVTVANSNSGTSAQAGVLGLSDGAIGFQMYATSSTFVGIDANYTGLAPASGVFESSSANTGGTRIFGGNSGGPVILFSASPPGAFKTEAERLRASPTELVVNEQQQAINFRVESNTNPHFLFGDASLDSGAGRWGMFTASPTAKLHINAGTLVTTVNGLRVDATFPTGGATEQFASRVLAVGAGSTDTGQSAFFAALNPGYTGAGYTTAMIFANTSAGTGTTGGVFADPANYGVYGYAAGTTSGRNIGGRFTTEGSSSANFGAVMGAVIGSNLPALNVGGQAYARGATTNVGFYAGLNGSQPTLSVSAAFIADNSDQTSPIFLARDNGSTVFALNDGMTSVAFGAGFDRTASGTYAIGGTNITTLTLGQSGQTVALAGATTVAQSASFNTSLGNFNFTVASDTQANALFLDSSLDGGFGRWGLFTASPTAKLHIAAGTLPAGLAAFRVDGTLPDTNHGIDAIFATTGTGTAGIIGAFFQLSDGATGTAGTRPIQGHNSVAGTGASPIGTPASPTDNGNFGGLFAAVATTTGTNAGARYRAEGGNVNIGAINLAWIDKASATNVGQIALGRNTAATPVQVGLYAGLNASMPTFTSAALIADNSDQTSPIFLGRDNGSIVFTLADAMTAVSFGSGLDRDASGTYAIGGTNITTLTLGRTGQAVAHAGTSTFAEGITFADAVNITVNATTGTKIGTTTTGKLGFFNAAPVAQQASVADATGGAVIDTEARAAINAVISNLEALGLQATV